MGREKNLGVRDTSDTPRRAVGPCGLVQENGYFTRWPRPRPQGYREPRCAPASRAGPTTQSLKNVDRGRQINQAFSSTPEIPRTPTIHVGFSGRIMSTIRLCAARFSGASACMYTDAVKSGAAWRSNSCTTFRFSLLSFKKFEKVPNTGCFNPCPHAAGDEGAAEIGKGAKFQSTPARGGRRRNGNFSAYNDLSSSLRGSKASDPPAASSDGCRP